MLTSDGAGCLAGKPVVAFREQHTLSRYWSTAVPGIRRSVGGSLSSSVLQYRNYSDEGLDGRVPPSPSAVDQFSGEFSAAVQITRAFGAHRPVHDRNAYPLRKCEGLRVYRPIVKLSWTALNEEQCSVPNCIRAFRNVGNESCHDSPRKGFGRVKQLPIGSPCATGNIRQPIASSTGEAIAILKHRRQQGLSIDPDMFVEILKRCSKHKDLTATRQVHEYIIQSGMQKDRYVATTLLNVYIKCGRLQDARRVFDGLERTNRTVITWNVMIGAYAKHGSGTEAYRLFHQMKREGFLPDAFTYSNILNASASAGALEWVKDVHSHARRAGLESDLRVGNGLVHMYAKSGSIDDARLVFDRMEKRDVITWNIMIRAYAENGSIDDARLLFDRMQKRDVITWNIMIGAYAGSGCGMEAYRLFLQMKREGFVPDAFTYSTILNPSAGAGGLHWLKGVHGHARRAGLESDLRVGTALIHMYAKNGSIEDARLTFDRMEKRDVITWNIMIGAYAESGCGVEAYELFLQMEREGIRPNALTYASILNPSASARDMDWVKGVHSHSRRAGLESDLRVGTALIQMYAKSGNIDDARLVFDRMEKRDLITCNIMIGAYAENGRIDDARRVFDRMEKRDVITWTTMIGAYAKRGFGIEAYRLFHQMKREGFIPDAFTYSSILNPSASAGALEWVKDVHSDARRAGLESDLRVGNALVHMYAKSGSIYDARLVFDRMEKRDLITWNIMLGAYAESGSIDDARLVFDRMDKRDVISWTTMIGASAESGCGLEAYGLFLQMNREGFIPNALTYASILNPSASAGDLDWVKDVHGHARRAGLESDLRVGNALIHMYAKNGSIEDARLIFQKMEKRDVVTWNSMIGGLALHGCGSEALKLFQKMIADSVKPDETSIVAVLSACCHGGLVDDGRRLFSAIMRDYGIEPTVVHYTCMVDLLGRAGHLEEAKLLIGDMPIEPNGVTWGALLGACRTYGNVELGELASKELLKLEPKNASAYVLLSNIYAAAGKWEKVCLVRSMMQERGVAKEQGRSWIEVDNKIHDFGVGDTAHPEAKAIYAELNKLTEKLKAEGYTPDTQLVLRNIDEEDKELALCSHSEKLAITYGLMRTPRGKPIRVFKNLRVCSDCHAATKLISDVTGREIIVRDANRFHHFKHGVCSCGDYW